MDSRLLPNLCANKNLLNNNILHLKKGVLSIKPYIMKAMAQPLLD